MADNSSFFYRMGRGFTISVFTALIMTIHIYMAGSFLPIISEKIPALTFDQTTGIAGSTLFIMLAIRTFYQFVIDDEPKEPRSYDCPRVSDCRWQEQAALAGRELCPPRDALARGDRPACVPVLKIGDGTMTKRGAENGIAIAITTTTQSLLKQLGDQIITLGLDNKEGAAFIAAVLGGAVFAIDGVDPRAAQVVRVIVGES